MISIHLRAGPYIDVLQYLKTFLFIGCIILMTDCNLFKNTATELRKSHELSTTSTQVKSEEQKDFRSKSGSIYFKQDSSNLDYSIQIWPRGIFTYSAAAGFSGEAEKVLVTGKSKAGSVSSDINSSMKIDQGKVQQSLSRREKAVSDQKLKTKKNSASWKSVIVGLACLGVLCCFIYTKLKLIFKSV